MRRRRGPTRLRPVALCCAVAAYFVSVLCHITYYGASVAWTVQGGFVGCYWGNRGTPGVRNSWVYNEWTVPWESRGTGRGWYGSPVWEIETPWDVWHPVRLQALLADCTFLKYQLGMMWPSIVLNSSRHGNEPESIVVPVWLISAVMTLPWLAVWMRAVQRIQAGSCRSCGYDLTGNVSGRCPECGAAGRPEVLRP
jgi:hypothetical protein